MLIVPAAGLGSRLKTTRPKLLVPVNGRPMLDWLLELYSDSIESTILIVHPSFDDQIRAYGAKMRAPIEYEIQSTPTGMLDAILLAQARIAASDVSQIWITWCDQVAIHPDTVARLAAEADAHSDAPLVMPTAIRREPYIHFERDPAGRITRVLHRREGDHLPTVGESDLGLFSLSRDALLRALPEFAGTAGTGGATKERNFLPFIPWIAARGQVRTFPCVDAMEAVGVNTPEELQAVERYLGARQLQGGSGRL